jgi:hypothetical protein
MHKSAMSFQKSAYRIGYGGIVVHDGDRRTIEV